MCTQTDKEEPGSDLIGRVPITALAKMINFDTSGSNGLKQPLWLLRLLTDMSAVAIER